GGVVGVVAQDDHVSGAAEGDREGRLVVEPTRPPRPEWRRGVEIGARRARRGPRAAAAGAGAARRRRRRGGRRTGRGARPRRAGGARAARSPGASRPAHRLAARDAEDGVAGDEAERDQDEGEVEPAGGGKSVRRRHGTDSGTLPWATQGVVPAGPAAA